MQVGGRRGEMMGRNATVRVRLMVWVGEMQLGERIGGVMVMNPTIQVRSEIWVGGRAGG